MNSNNIIFMSFYAAKSGMKFKSLMKFMKLNIKLYNLQSKIRARERKLKLIEYSEEWENTLQQALNLGVKQREIIKKMESLLNE